MKNIILIFILSLTNITFAETINCKVIAITGGDTIKCLTDNKEQLKIRLYQIDAPETKQAFGNKSKQALSNIIFNKDVQVETYGKDKYHRILGTIYYQGLYSCGITRECLKTYDVNLIMIETGMAWYWPFAKENNQYKQAEDQARLNKVGLWADKNPVAPWEFSKSK